MNRRIIVIAVVIGLLLIALVVAAIALTRPNQQQQLSSAFEPLEIPLSDFMNSQDISLLGTRNLTINGQLQLNDAFVISPSTQPTNATAGQIYYDQTSNLLSYFNGDEFVDLPGNVSVGDGISNTNGILANSGVLSLQGQTGNVTLTSGGGIAIDGTTLTNTGVTSLGDATGDITLGAGLSMTDNTLTNAGVNSLTAGTVNLVIANDGAGNLTISDVGGGSGTVSSPGGTAGRIAKFTGVQTIEDSLLSEAGTTVTVNGDLTVTGNTNLSNPLTVGNGGTGATSLANNGVVISHGAGPFTAVTAGGAGLCLLSTVGAPTWGACPGGGGVTSLNSLTGALTLANSTGVGTTLTIDDASTTQKGIAQFNATNFTALAGVINTIQNIHTGASPTFVSQTLTGDLAVNGGDITSTGALNISPGGTLVVGATSQTLTLQGGASTSLSATSGANATILNFQAPTANVTYRIPTAAAGSYDICSTAGNCAGVGGGVTTAGGTTNRLSKFTAAQGIGDSTITDNGTTVSTTVDLIVQGGDVTVGVASSQTGTINLAHSASGFLGTITQGALTGNRTYTLPDASGTFCLTSGNCSGSGSSNTLQAAYDAGNSITTTSGRDIDIVLADTVADSNLDIVVADGSASFVSFARANGAGTTDPAQLLLVDNLDSDRALPVGLRIQSAAGGMTTGIDASDAELVTALSVGDNNIVGGTGNIDLTNFDVVGSTGNITTSGDIAVNGGDVTSTGALTITAGSTLTVGSTGQALTLQGNASTSLSATNGGTTNTLSFAAPSGGNKTVTIGNESGTICIQNSTSCGFTTSANAFVQNGNTFGATATLGTNDAFDLAIERGGATQLTVGSGTVTLASDVDLLLQGTNAFISNPQGTASSEAFGSGASSTGLRSVALGNGATTGASNNAVAVGRSASALFDSVAIGEVATCSNNQCIAIGQSSVASFNATAVGYDASANNNEATALGSSTVTGGVESIALGSGATTTAANQMVVGSTTAAISQVVIGNGVTNAAPTGFTLQGTGGSGSNVAGASVVVAGGQGTGTGNGGSVNFQIADPGASGSSLNPLSTVLSLSGTNGAATFQNSTDSSAAFRVLNSSASAVFTLNTTNSSAIINGNLSGSQGFEGVTFPPASPGTWTTGGNVAWSRTTSVFQEGAASAASGTIGDSQSSFLDLDYTFTNNGVLKFYWKVDNGSEENFDFLYLCVDNDACGTPGHTAISGNVDWTEVSVPVTAGAHSFRWIYAKDSCCADAQDKGWLDNVRLYDGGNLAVDGNITTSSSVGIGTSSPTTALDVRGETTLQALNGEGASLQVKSDDGSNLFRVSNEFNEVRIGNHTTGDSTAILFVLDEKNTSGDPGALLSNGAMYYNSNMGKFRCYEANSWKDCVTANGFVQNGNSFGATATIGTNDANALDFETGGTTRMTLGATGGLSLISGNSLTVSAALTSLTGATSGDALNVSNSTSTGNIAVFKDNATNVLVIADGGLTSFTPQTSSASAFRVYDTNGTTPLLGIDNAADYLYTDGNLSVALNAEVDQDLIVGDQAYIGGATDNTEAFVVYNTSDTLFQIDGQNSRVYIGDLLADSTGALLVLDTKDTSGDPTAVNGAMYYSSARQSFRCYEDGIWYNCRASSKSDYRVFTEIVSQADEAPFGTFTDGSGTNAFQVAIPNHPGYMQHETDTSATGGAGIGVNSSDNWLLFGNGDTWRYDTMIRIQTLSTATQRFVLRVGFHDDNAFGDPSDGCMFRYTDDVNNGEWQGYCADAGTATCDSNIVPVVNQWVRLTVVVTGTQADFRINGTSACTVSSQIPTTAGNYTGANQTIRKTVGTTERTFQTDYVEVTADLTRPTP